MLVMGHGPGPQGVKAAPERNHHPNAKSLGMKRERILGPIAPTEHISAAPPANGERRPASGWGRRAIVSRASGAPPRKAITQPSPTGAAERYECPNRRMREKRAAGRGDARPPANGARHCGGLGGMASEHGCAWSARPPAPFVALFSAPWRFPCVPCGKKPAAG